MKVAATIAALGLFGLSTAAFARAPDAFGAPRIEVSYADLNLRSPAGAEVMLNRIRWAAARVCERPDIREVNFMAIYRACESAAVRNAVAELNAAMVSQLYYGSRGAMRETAITQR